MKLCPECHSDAIEGTSLSTAGRAVVCIVLLFIPYGIFFCWLPFVFPHTFRCNLCGHEDKEEKIMNIDWRDREELQEKHRQMEKKISPLMDRWFQDEEKVLYKLTKGNGLFLVLRIEENEINPLIKPFRILDYEGDPSKGVLRVKEMSPKLHVLKEFTHSADIELSDFGQGLFTKEEFSLIKQNDLEGLIKLLREKDRIIKSVQISSNK